VYDCDLLSRWVLFRVRPVSAPLQLSCDRRVFVGDVAVSVHVTLSRGWLASPYHCWLGVVVKAFVRQPRGRVFDSWSGRMFAALGRKLPWPEHTWPAAVVVVQRRLLKYGVSLWLDQHGTVACDPPLGTSGVTDYLFGMLCWCEALACVWTVIFACGPGLHPSGQLLWLWFSPRAHSAHSQKLSGLLTGHWLAAARCGTDDHIAAGQFLPSFSLFLRSFLARHAGCV